MTTTKKFKCMTCGKITRDEGHKFSHYLGDACWENCYDCEREDIRTEAINAQHEEALGLDRARQTIINEMDHLTNGVIEIGDHLRKESEQGIGLNYETLRLKKKIDVQAGVLAIALREWWITKGEGDLILNRAKLDKSRSDYLGDDRFCIPAEKYLSDEIIHFEACISTYGFLADVARSFDI